MARLRSVFRFPNPVNEKAARVVAGGVVVMAVVAIVLGALGQGWPLAVIAAGFWARVLTGPTLSPLGQFAVRVAAPRLGEPKPVAGPPKRFAQGIGVVFSSTALILWFGFDVRPAALAVVAMLAVAALLESAFGYCLGCKVFALLMRAGVVPDEVCAACSDIRLHQTGTDDSSPVDLPPYPATSSTVSGAASRSARVATNPVSSLAHDT